VASATAALEHHHHQYLDNPAAHHLTDDDHAHDIAPTHHHPHHYAPAAHDEHLVAHDAHVGHTPAQVQRQQLRAGRDGHAAGQASGADEPPGRLPRLPDQDGAHARRRLRRRYGRAPPGARLRVGLPRRRRLRKRLLLLGHSHRRGKGARLSGRTAPDSVP